MKTRVALLTVALLGMAPFSWADGELIYPWDNPPPAPGADCLDMPCVPCVFSLPGLRSLGAARQPCKVPETEVDAPTVAVRGPGQGPHRGEN